MVREIVKDKFKNNRKRKARVLSETADNNPSQSKRLKAVVGLPEYRPPFKEEVVPQMMALSNQLRLLNCSPEEKESLLAKTFAWRRHLITQDHRSINDITNLFPGLFEEEEVCTLKVVLISSFCQSFIVTPLRVYLACS